MALAGQRVCDPGARAKEGRDWASQDHQKPSRFDLLSKMVITHEKRKWHGIGPFVDERRERHCMNPGLDEATDEAKFAELFSGGYWFGRRSPGRNFKS